MKREYVTPDLEIVAFLLNNVCNDVIHSSYENGGYNYGWGFGNDDDDDDFGDLL